MKDFSKWQDSAAEEAKEELLKSSMDVCSRMRKDVDEKRDVDHEKLESLQYSWKALKSMVQKSQNGGENALSKIIKPEDKFNRKLPSIDDYITSPVKI